MLTIYHNPRCSKSRQTLQLIRESDNLVEIVEYLDDHLSADELEELLEKLGIKAEQLVRKGEAIYKENFRGKSLSEKEWIQAMVEYPKLIERPIVVKDDKAVLGRPPENVKALL
ncbi:MAG: arsenate reductase (glutaredoxin) [Roseivirga sp.]